MPSAFDRFLLRGVCCFPLALPAALALVLGLSSTIGLFVWASHFEHGNLDINFRRRANITSMFFQEEMDDALLALQAVNQLFSTVAPVSRTQFRTFTQPLLARLPYIQALSFHRLVSAAERPGYEAQMRRLYPDFTITETGNDGKPMVAAVRQQYRVVDYLEPLAGNEAALGLDVNRRQDQQAALERATDTGLASATGLFRLAQGNVQRGFLVLMPVYRQGLVLDTVTARRQAVIGYTAAVFLANDLAKSLLAVAAGTRDTDGLHVSVYAAAGADEGALAFRSGSAAPVARLPAPVLLPRWLRQDPGLSFSRTVNVAGTPWLVSVSMPPLPFLAHHLGSLLTLIAGTVLSLLAAAFLQVQHRRLARLGLDNASLNDSLAARKRMEEALRQSQQMLRQLAVHQDRIKEDERKRIAREIHDDLGQNLLALRIDVSMLHARTGNRHPLLHKKTGYALQTIDATVKSVREIINNLRPAVLNLGLRAAIEWQVQQFQLRSGIVCELEEDERGLDLGVAEDRDTALFRILQESLSNVRRHAQATRIRVQLRRNGDLLCLTITDNGTGILPGDRRKTRTFGLLGIEERVNALGGRMTIDSVPDRGMTISLSIPIAEKTTTGR
jgi:signal transduction histidine kinase